MTTHTTHSLSTFERFRLWFWLVSAVLFFVFLSLVKSILLPFVVGMLAAYFLDPAVSKLRAKGWSRTLASGVITISFFIVAVALGIVLVPLIAHQLSTLITELPALVQSVQDKYGDDVGRYIAQLSPDQTDTIKNAGANFSGEIAGWAGRVATGVVKSGLALLNILSLFFLTPVVAFYLLRDWNKVTARFDNLLPRAEASTIREQMRAIDRTLSGFIRGQTNVCLLMATYYAITLTLTGLKFGLGIGILTGLMLFVPFVGFATGFTLSLVVALFQFNDASHIIMVLAIYGVGLMVESSVITPRLVGGKVGLHPLWIIFGMLSGAALFGFVGVLISVPVTAVIGVLVRFAIERYLQSPLYKSR